MCRTKEQLGYVVDSESQDLHGILGFSFMVQSAKYSPKYIEGRINVFIKHIPQLLVVTMTSNLSFALVCYLYVIFSGDIAGSQCDHVFMSAIDCT